MSKLFRLLRIALVIIVLPFLAMADELTPFAGTYSGAAEFENNGTLESRDMSVTITPTKEGFELSWTSVTYRSDGRTKEATYTIDFIPSQRENIYGSAMKKNVFGKSVPLDPLAGEPFVWARLDGDTLSVYSLFINEVGEYELQEYHRTLTDGGLDLAFRRLRNGQAERDISTFLERQD